MNEDGNVSSIAVSIEIVVLIIEKNFSWFVVYYSRWLPLDQHRLRLLSPEIVNAARLCRLIWQSNWRGQRIEHLHHRRWWGRSDLFEGTSIGSHMLPCGQRKARLSWQTSSGIMAVLVSHFGDTWIRLYEGVAWTWLPSAKAHRFQSALCDYGAGQRLHAVSERTFGASNNRKF